MENNHYVICGDKILSSFSLFLNKERKLDKAMKFYTKACKEFIKNRDFFNYANLSEKIGDEYSKIIHYIHALNYYKNAQKYFLNIDVDKYINITVNKIIPLHIENNNIEDIGKSYYELAKLYKDDNYNSEIFNYFKKAITYLQTNNSQELLNCYIDFTYYLLDCGNIDDAIYYLEQIINRMCESNLLLFRVNTYIFLYLLCIMTNDDIILLKRELNKYCKVVYKFINFPGHKLIDQLTKKYEDNDIDNFITLIYEYDKIYNLKPREVKLLVVIKNNLTINNEVVLS
jgi:tetratricopeptide (TPR) repeat protein